MKSRLFVAFALVCCAALFVSAQKPLTDFAGGNILLFDGETVLGRSIRNLPSGNSDRTLAVMFRIGEFRSEEVFLGGYGDFGEFGRSYHLGTSRGRLFFSQWGQAIWGPQLKTGVWYEAVVNNRGDEIRLYLNGCLEGSGTLPLNTPPKSDFYLGRLPGSIGDIRQLFGEIGSARIYDRALEPNEIKPDFDRDSFFATCTAFQ